MPLSDPAIKNAKPKAKPYKLTDGNGLFLMVNAAGKYWRLAYRFGGKQKTLALGVYPDVPLGLQALQQLCGHAPEIVIVFRRHRRKRQVIEGDRYGVSRRHLRGGRKGGAG